MMPRSSAKTDEADTELGAVSEVAGTDVRGAMVSVGDRMALADATEGDEVMMDKGI